VLKGHKATTNKAFFSLAVDQVARSTGRARRWVEDGRCPSGVSAGTDMALGLIARLYGKERAGMLAHSLEYEWNDDPTNDPFAVNFTR
jgi:transcriptional regulator GlxA family with amidase domain